jgi:hypothetical protein
MSERGRLALVVIPVVSLFASSAWAQGSDTPAPAPIPAAPGEKPVAAGTTTTATTTTTTAATTTPAATTTTTTDAPAASTGTDFSKIVRTIGIGYFGQYDVPLGSGTGARNIGTQLVGVRYFFSERAGIDVGVGMGIASGSNKTEGGTGTTATTVDRPSTLAMSFKVGVPIVMYSGQHYSFFFEPQALFGFAGETAKATTPGTADTKRSGTRLFAGGNAGALVQFGFIGIPQLTLDATVGFGLDVQGGKTESPAPGAPANVVKNSFSQTAFGTLSSHQPWNIFHTNVAAIYHF